MACQSTHIAGIDASYTTEHLVARLQQSLDRDREYIDAIRRGDTKYVDAQPPRALHAQLLWSFEVKEHGRCVATRVTPLAVACVFENEAMVRHLAKTPNKYQSVHLSLFTFFFFAPLYNFPLVPPRAIDWALECRIIDFATECECAYENEVDWLHPLLNAPPRYAEEFLLVLLRHGFFHGGDPFGDWCESAEEYPFGVAFNILFEAMSRMSDEERYQHIPRVTDKLLEHEFPRNRKRAAESIADATTFANYKQYFDAHRNAITKQQQQRYATMRKWKEEYVLSAKLVLFAAFDDIIRHAAL